MYAICISICKGHYQQFYSRLCIQGTSRVQKLMCRLSASEKNQARRVWWKTGFRNIFGKYLIVTNIISSGILMAVGDLIQQEMEYYGSGKHANSFDWERFVNMGIVGTFQGPFSHFFYQILDSYLPGVKFSAIATKIVLDQTIASPLCIVLFFLGYNYLSKVPFEKSKAELKEKFWIIYAADCFIWIPAQFLNFYCLPAKYRVIYINLITMCYNVFLSFMKHERD